MELSHVGRVKSVELLPKPVVRAPRSMTGPETPECAAGLATDPDLFACLLLQKPRRTAVKQGREDWQVWPQVQNGLASNDHTTPSCSKPCRSWLPVQGGMCTPGSAKQSPGPESKVSSAKWSREQGSQRSDLPMGLGHVRNLCFEGSVPGAFTRLAPRWPDASPGCLTPAWESSLLGSLTPHKFSEQSIL